MDGELLDVENDARLCHVAHHKNQLDAARL
jgi:hypothetical protein